MSDQMDDLYVLKFGGNAIRGKADLERLSKDISQLRSKGAKIVLVHGGGPEISDEMAKRGLEPKKVAGIRITDEDALEVAETVLRRINEDVVLSLESEGMQAVGMPGHFCTVCEKKAPVKVKEDGIEKEVDVGLVGEVKDMDPNCILDLLIQDVIPVIYPIGKDADGNKLNVNADTMVAGIAAGLSCKEMITITDVPGILMDVNDPSSKLDEVTFDEIDDLISKEVISGGMIPKVEACRKALLAGVKKVRMVNGKDPDCIVSDLMDENNRHGTIITR